jgi:hypothetical protein
MNKFCHHPWVGLDVSPQGEFKPCCKYRHTVADNLNDYWASDHLQQLREDFLAGRQPEGCGRCWQDESADLPSKRQLDWKYLFRETDPDHDHVVSLSLPFGNTCNLACRICSSHSSSRWATEAKKLSSYFPDIPIFEHQRFYRDDAFMKNMRDLATEGLRHIDFPGGEPFITGVDQQIGFLEHLVRSGRASEISLHYTTNGTTKPDPRFLELWNEFRAIDIQVSIDGIEQQFEYNRWPARWIEVLPNIIFYNREMPLLVPEMRLSISHSVSVFTIWHLPEFIDWAQRLELPAPYLGLVSRPEHYSITVLPEQAKKALDQRLVAPLLEPVRRAMWASDGTERLDILMRYVKILDTHRDQSFPDTYPELFKLLGEKCQTLYQLY